MTNFNVKYLFELYPNINFQEDFVISQDVTELNVLYESQATKEMLPHIFDTVNKKRLIQTVKKRQYEVVFFLSRNIDAARLAVGSVTITTTTNEIFIAHEIELNYAKIEGTLDYKLTLKFYRYDNDIINHLSHKNAVLYDSRVSAANRINFKVKNPSYAFNNIDIDIYSYQDETDYRAAFKVPFNDLSDTININDSFYLHTNNTDFNNEIDSNGDYLNFARCRNKDSDYVYFDCSSGIVSSTLSYNINNLIIDHEPDYLDIPPDITVQDREIAFNIYTFLNPIYKNEEKDNESIKKKDEISYTDKTISYDIISIKFWLTEENLYLKKYLHFATQIKILLVNGTTIIPISKTRIIESIEKAELIKLSEFNLSAKYNYMIVPNKNTF